MRKRLRRKVHVKGRETASERQARTAVRYIMDNPYYPMILKAIRNGTPNSKIAEWCISRGIMDVNQKTAVGYLQYFRKMQPGLCKPQEGELPGYDHLINGNAVIIDEEVELLKLIELQKARIGIAFGNERSLNMIMNNNRREVEELRELLMALAKMRGLIGNSLDVNLHGYSEQVRDDLKGIRQDEGHRNIIATLVADLASVEANA
jgi:hypothetical protein